MIELDSGIYFSYVNVADWIDGFSRYLMKWTPLHVVGLFLLCVPVLAVYTNFACDAVFNSWQSADGFCLLAFAFLLHFTNFSQVNFWLRSLFATVAGFSLVLFIGECGSSNSLLLDMSIYQLVYTQPTNRPPTQSLF